MRLLLRSQLVVAPPTRFRAVTWVMAIAMGAIAACSTVSSNAQPVVDHPGLPPLAFNLASIDGGRLSAVALRGRYVVLKPFAAWCAPCRSELPLLVEASAKFLGSPVSFVAVSFDKDPAAAQRLVTELGVPFPVAYDPEGRMAAALALQSLTVVYLFDPGGNLVVRYIHCDRASVDELIRKLDRLTQHTSSAPSRGAGH